MPSPLVSPNLHVILIHYPLGLLVVGVFIELFSFLWPRNSIRSAGRWMILLGALAAIPAAYSGIYALRDVARMDPDQPWLRYRIDSPVFKDPVIYRMLIRHTVIQSIAVAVMALVVTVWLGCSDRARLKLRLPALLLMVLSVAAMGTGAWFGGESIYRHGVAVETVFPIAPEYEAPSTQPATWTTKPTKIENMFPPLELHVIAAGTLTALTLAALGLSFRRLTTLYELPVKTPLVVSDQRMGQPVKPPSEVNMARSLNPDVEIDLHFSAPAGRYWLLAFVVAVLTAVGGIFVFSRSASIPLDSIKNPKNFAGVYWDVIRPDNGHKITRLTAHLAAGVLLIALPLLMAVQARFLPRNRLVLWVMTFALLLVLALQVWFGLLLLFDATDGPIQHLTRAT